MAMLVTLKGPMTGRQIPLMPHCTLIGRQIDSNVCLESQSVSRHHAQIIQEDGDFFVEDLNSSNGTFLNNKRIAGRVPLAEKDSLTIGPYVFQLRRAPAVGPADDEQVIRDSVPAEPSNHGLTGPDAPRKLQAVLDIAQHLARTLDIDELLGRLLVQLLELFPQADRGLVILCDGDGDRFAVRSQLCRAGAGESARHPYSRTIVRRALDEGVGLYSEDAKADERFQASSTLTSLKLHSLLCVPMICPDGRRLGVLQLDQFQKDQAFRSEDLQLLAAIGLQVTIVLENAALHIEVLQEERLHQELAMAREIQQGFLPNEFPPPEQVGFDLYARVHPAREVAGDLYDFVPLGQKRLAFFVGDVSGKGMPAALFMVAVRTLCRHVAKSGVSPADTLRRLNDALAADNPSGMFVTLIHGIYHADTGKVVMASGGHPVPLLRHADGRVESLSLPVGRLLGYEAPELRWTDAEITMAPQDTLVLYTDGFVEARGADDAQTPFGAARLQQSIGGNRTGLPLKDCADFVERDIEEFTGAVELQDDLTLFLLRRVR